MAPKVNCNPLKLSNIVTYFQKSRVAHTLKDLEKALPSVASINGMQVKDYLQHLQDENRISVEKIGSGNWFWCFPSEQKKIRERALAEAQSTHDKAASVVNDLKQKLADINAQHEDEAEMLDNGAESREELVESKAALQSDVKRLEKALEAYRDTDPTEIERKKAVVQLLRDQATQCTEEIYSMEGWFKERTGSDEVIAALRQMIDYGAELDEEEGVLKELV
ncbi:uncharacterized protein LTR77_002382 [Saxophila tyrrhenica]|uniref:Meiotic nuclear division protein 1 n=1 Tax=Saxophila tyrrhenica TaxID=1690608 RepID=A0AAV9PN62_9PEZI|nr:hypothetical protein LTR77_002382 [Saxophila tyrrhenica]